MALLSDRAAAQGSARDAERECCPDGTGPKQKENFIDRVALVWALAPGLPDSCRLKNYQAT